MKPTTLHYLSLISLLLFILLAFSFPLFSSLDQTLNTTLPHPALITSVSRFIDLAFDTIPLFIISLILSALLWLSKNRPAALQLSLTMAADAILIFIIKNIVARPRPFNASISASDFSFPSGHTASAVVFFGLLTYLLANKKTQPATAVSILLVIMIGLSRLFLGIHWLTDIIGGLLLGTFILTTSILIRKSLA